ncbi:MAG: prepilin-type N-terminal cleavage/methylation domain-containing protein, partial [Dehalococcoidia bacterium]
SQSSQAGIRSGFTLAEVLVAVTLVIVLTGIVLLGGQAIRSSRKLAAAQQQLALMAQAIDQYVSFWPRWKVGSTVVAEKGWPDFIPGRLFELSTFEAVSGFNDHLAYDLEDGIVQFDRQDQNLDVVGSGHVMHGNICLAYCLTASSGKGPHLLENDTAVLKDVGDPVLMEGFQRLGQALVRPLLPAYVGTSGSKRAQVLVDPWGTPYRYFWVYRDTASAPTPRAHAGYLPVLTADMGGDDDPPPPTAEGYVLESAGPDRKFGNVWKVNPSGSEIEEASDNLTLMP